MRKVKLTLLFLSVFAIMFGFKNVYAQDTFEYNDNGKIIFKTEITNWTPVNELMWHGEDKCDNHDCTYSAYIQGRGYNGTTVVNNLKVDLPTDDDVYLGVDLSYRDQIDERWQNYAFKFYAGTTVTLYEVFDYSSVGSCGDYTYCVNENLDSIEYSLEDNLYFTFDDDDVKRKALSNCNNYTGNTYSVYYDKVKDTGDSSSYNEYRYVDYGGKSNNIDNGTIALPIYEVSINVNYYGNLIGDTGYAPGDISKPQPTIGFSSHWRECDYEDQRCRNNVLIDSYSSDSWGYSHEALIGGGEYSIMTYSQFSDYKSFYPSYDFMSYNPKLVGSTGGVSTTYSYNNSDGCHIEENYDNDPTRIKIYCDVTLNATVPNGLFYNILPFIVILLIAGAGIVVIKKTKLKA